MGDVNHYGTAHYRMNLGKPAQAPHLILIKGEIAKLQCAVGRELWRVLGYDPTPR